LTFYYLVPQGIILRPTFPVQNLTSSLIQPSAVVLQSTVPKSSSLRYRNPRLEKFIHAKQSRSQLFLSSMELVDQDMETLASYLLRNDTVRNKNLLYSILK
jgi:hypothetical protein